MARRAAIGIIGCGNISEAYLRLAPIFKDVEDRRGRRHHAGGGAGRAPSNSR